MARRYLLSIDGGGIRGIIPAIALMKLEQTTGKLSRDTFSFAAGTSTGALIAAALASGLPAPQIRNVYLNRARDVFTKGPFSDVKRFFSGHIYSIQKLLDLLADVLPTARNWTLNDSPIDLLITAKRVRDGMPWYFVRDKPGLNSGQTGHLRLLECVTASAAAPTYFEPWKIAEIGDLVDGGVGVTGNPVYQACVEAFFYDRYKPEETTVISMGTGRFLFEQETPGSLLSWLEWTIDDLLRSPGEQQTEIVWRHFPKEMPFYRIDPDLRAIDPALTEPIPLDDVGSVDKLRRYGEVFAEKIDWTAILNGTDETFRVRQGNTLFQQYKRA